MSFGILSIRDHFADNNFCSSQALIPLSTSLVLHAIPMEK